MNTAQPFTGETLETWKANRQLTYDLLEQLSADDLDAKWPRPGLDTFAKHMLEMAVVQEAFCHAMQEGTMDFSEVPDVFDFEQTNDKSAIRGRLRAADERLSKVAAGCTKTDLVDWDGLKVSMNEHWTNLISHEVFHQGMMVMALYLMNKPIPQSWQDNWALPNTTT